MIYLIQEFYDGKWWLVQPFVSFFHAKEYLGYLERKDKYAVYRVKEFELSKDYDD